MVTRENRELRTMIGIDKPTHRALRDNARAHGISLTEYLRALAREVPSLEGNRKRMDEGFSLFAEVLKELMSRTDELKEWHNKDSKTLLNGIDALRSELASYQERVAQSVFNINLRHLLTEHPNSEMIAKFKEIGVLTPDGRLIDDGK